MKTTIASMCFCIVLSSAAMQAHHSFYAEFDPAKPITLTGRVTKIEWANPHIFFFVDVKDATGTVVNWAVEMGNPLSLLRLGWTRNDMKIGDVVTVDGALARDGSKLVNAKAVLLNGRKMFAGSSQAATP